MNLRQTASLKNFLLLEPQERCQILTSGVPSRIKETQTVGSSVLKTKLKEEADSDPKSLLSHRLIYRDERWKGQRPDLQVQSAEQLRSQQEGRCLGKRHFLAPRVSLSC